MISVQPLRLLQDEALTEQDSCNLYHRLTVLQFLFGALVKTFLPLHLPMIALSYFVSFYSEYATSEDN